MKITQRLWGIVGIISNSHGRAKTLRVWDSIYFGQLYCIAYEMCPKMRQQPPTFGFRLFHQFLDDVVKVWRSSDPWHLSQFPLDSHADVPVLQQFFQFLEGLEHTQKHIHSIHELTYHSEYKIPIPYQKQCSTEGHFYPFYTTAQSHEIVRLWKINWDYKNSLNSPVRVRTSTVPFISRSILSIAWLAQYFSDPYWRAINW